MDYYTPEKMQGKKVSDLKMDRNFLSDAVTFLKSNRKGMTDEELSKYTPDDVVDEVLEHFRMGTMNEVTMAKDLYFVNDEQAPETDRQAYGRLLFSFDNAEGEGILDRGGEAVYDYAKGIATAPSTYLSVAAGAFTGGAGGAAVQATKLGAQQAVRKVANKLIGRSVMVGALEGTMAAGSQLGLERIKQSAGKEIGEDYDVNMGNVALAGGLGTAIGGAAYAIPAMRRNKAAHRLVDTFDKGRQANVAALQTANANTETSIKKALSTAEGKKRMTFTTNRLLKAIDPALVKEGMAAKYDILSDTLPDGLIGGLERSTLRRITAASFELSKALGVKPESGQRITELLAKTIDENGNSDIFTKIASDFGLSNRQLSAVYAAEVSEAAKILADQSKLVSKGGANIVGAINAKTFSDDIQRLYNAGMSTVDADEAKKALDAGAAAGHGIAGRAWRKFKDIESSRRAFMTSQVATTMRNNIFGVAMTGIDMLDQVNTGIYRLLTGRGKEAISTFKGTVDTFNYLTKDNATAEAMMKILRQDAPETLSRVFQDAAMAESSLVSNSFFARYGKAFNTLNTMSDHTFKKAVIAGNLDRQFKANGSSLLKEMEAGRLGNISNEMLTEALDESLSFTFQRKFGSKGSSAESQITKEIVDTINKSGLTLLIPFPRYMASQAKFISDYTGLTLIRRLGTGRKIADEEFGKAASGAAMFGALYAVQKGNIENDLEWFNGQTDDGQTYDAQAALGPAAMHAYLANLVARIQGGHEVKDTAAIKKDIVKITVGTEFRPSGTAIDKAIRWAETGDNKAFIDWFFDTVSAFTYPAAVVKDFYGQLDPRASYFPETRDATVSLLEATGPMELAMSSYQRITRQLPDFNSATMANTLDEMTGIKMDPKKMEGFLEFFKSSTRATFQTDYLENADEGYDAIRMDIFGEGPLRATNPFLKQILGISGKPRSNVLQREMVKLQLDPFKIYNPYREKNPAVSILAEQSMQGHLLDEMKKLISSTLYQSSTVEEQKLLLSGGNGYTEKWENVKGIKDYVSMARKNARENLALAASDPKYQGDYINWTRGRLQALGPADRKTLAPMFQRYAVGTAYEGMTIEESIADIKADKDMNEREKDIKTTTLINYYLSME